MYTKEQMIELNEKLKKASKAYYNDNVEIMSNKQYDALYDTLLDMERELGYTLPDSITQTVGYEVVSNLKKEKHEQKALSLDKTKDRQGLANWLGAEKGCMSWKEDGLTLVLTYDNATLTKAVTRGNGEIGEVVTHNAKYIKGIPKHIPYDGHLVLRGETVMSYRNFELINSKIMDVGSKYKNARNLASGTLRSLDSKVVAERGLTFIAFELVTIDKGSVDYGDGTYGPSNLFSENLDWLERQGFNVVEHVSCYAKDVVKAIESFEGKLKSNEYPSDGLVLQIENVSYAKSLGTTGKFPRSGKAFKWKDETATTVIRDIEWNASRTGLINPVAVFDPVDLDGTTVRRATANNISFMKKLHITIGSTISVYKANMIIPTIDSNINPVGQLIIPHFCPSCGGAALVRQTAEAEVLFCGNPDCPAKNLKHFEHFVSRDAMNIVGLAGSTIEKLIENGYVQNYLDLYYISSKLAIANMEGFGEGSYKNLVTAIENSKDVKLGNFIYAFGIDMVGKTASKDIANHVKTVENFINAMDNCYDFRKIDGIGDKTNLNLHKWWRTAANRKLFIALSYMMRFVTVAEPKQVNSNNGNANNTGSSGIAGKTFCVTGSVNIFPNRNAVGEYIEARGGKLASSVSAKTDYLVTNDTTSGSAKNKKAKELGKPILTEQQLIDLGGGL